MAPRVEVERVRDFGTDGVRAAGPEVVWHGPEDAPVVVVLDPAGEAKHDELPATWRPLAEHLRIGWCRLPAGAEVFDQPPRSAPVHLVAAGTAVEPALRLAQRHSGSVRSLTAIDPVPAEASAVDDQHDWWDRDTAPVRQELTERGVRVHGFVSRDSDPTIRIEPPVPLGHPHVVARVVQLLRSVDPGRPELAQAWQTVREQVGPALERAEETGRTT